MNVVQNSPERQIPGVILFTDFHKAYDSFYLRISNTIFYTFKFWTKYLCCSTRPSINCVIQNGIFKIEGAVANVTQNSTINSVEIMSPKYNPTKWIYRLVKEVTKWRGKVCLLQCANNSFILRQLKKEVWNLHYRPSLPLR